mgnify:FL=1
MSRQQDEAWKSLLAAAQSPSIESQRSAAAEMLEKLYPDDSALLAVADLLRGNALSHPKPWEEKAHMIVTYLHDVAGKPYEEAYDLARIEVNKSWSAVRKASNKCRAIERSFRDLQDKLTGD